MGHDRDDEYNGRRLTAQELALWRAVTKDVTLSQDAVYREGDDGLESFEAMLDATASGKSTPEGPADSVPASSSARRPASARDLDKRTAMRLQRGQLDIEGRIDLHGLGRQVAQDTLIRFLQDAYRRGNRCVLVITGKGRIVMDDHLEEETPGVLRRALPGWLHQAPLDHIVLSHAPASDKHGGGGAFYILLRRQR